MKTRLLPVFLSIFLLTSFFTPVVNAEPVILAPAAAAAVPEVYEFIVAEMTILVSGVVIVEIGENRPEMRD